MNLATLNLGAGALHTIVGSGLCLWTGLKFNNKQNAIDTSTWTVVSSDNLRPKLVKTSETNTASIVWMLIGFVFITAAVHFLIYMCKDGRYRSYLDKKNNPLRWIEYAITSTLMLIAIGFSVGIKEINTIVLIAVTNVITMLMGDLVEKVTNERRTDKYIQRVLTSVGWLLMLLNFGIIISTFIRTKDNNKQMPSFVAPLIGTMLVLFSSFGVVQLLYTSEIITFIQSEIIYTILSFVSKVLLVGLVFGGIAGRQSG